jgi:hypothetical protein
VTHSPAERGADAERVLRRMLADVGDRIVLEQDFPMDSAVIVEALPPTLYDLEQGA